MEELYKWGAIEGEQLRNLRESSQRAIERKQLGHLFVFLHLMFRL